MTNLSITAKTNVDECIQIDYITILTKDGKEIDLNWEYSHYTPFEPFNSPHSILKSIKAKQSTTSIGITAPHGRG